MCLTILSDKEEYKVLESGPRGILEFLLSEALAWLKCHPIVSGVNSLILSGSILTRF